MQLTNAKRLRALLLVIVVGLITSVVFVQGQGTTGSLTGQVTDPSDAAIPGAIVTLTNVDTNYSQTVKTDTTGVYQFKLLQPGNYALTISAASFAEYLQKGIVINANLYATQNVHLKVATAKGETVNVTADAELINTETAELGMSINQQSVTDLPLNGRDPSSLALLAPGMVDGN
jgi:protocatechuate 3,4-dioxygenase beta subunit